MRGPLKDTSHCRPVKTGVLGGLLIEVLISALIVMIGLVPILNLMTKLSEISFKRSVKGEIAYFSMSKQNALMADSYSVMVDSPTQSSGDFTDLMGTDVGSSINGYTWSYTSEQKAPGGLRKVYLTVNYAGAKSSVSSDSLVFYKADLDNEVP